MKYDEHGHEIHDQGRIEMPAGFKRPESLNETIARMVRYQVENAARAAGHETFEEAMDFDMEENDELSDSPTRYEEMGDDVSLTNFNSRDHVAEAKAKIKKHKGDTDREETDGSDRSMRQRSNRPNRSQQRDDVNTEDDQTED